MSESQSITLQLSDLIHSRQHPDRILDIINTHNMTQYYLLVTHTLHLLPFQQHTLDTLQLHNKHTLTKLDQDILDAVKNLGETEVRDAHLAKARFFDIIGDKQEALKNYEETLAKTVGIGQKIDLVFEIMRLGFAWKDTSIIKSYLLKAKE
jgi:26S proteasome regulatory subunit N7